MHLTCPKSAACSNHSTFESTGPQGRTPKSRATLQYFQNCILRTLQYNETTPSSGPRNLRLAVRKRLTLQGFIVSDHLDRQAQFYNDMGAWIAAGKIKWQETIIAGIENAPEAFIGLFKGDNVGKMLVKL